MSTASNASGGGEQNPGGTSGKEENQNESTTTPPAKDSVSYASYQKLLDEKKTVQAKVAAFEKAQREAEESKLKQDGEYKKLLEQRESELAEERKKHTDLASQVADSRKLNAFLGAVTGEVPQQYWPLIDMSKIAVDPETGKPDKASVKKAAEEFEKAHPEVVKKANKGRLPNDAANGGSAPVGFSAEIRAAKTQQQLDAVLAKYGKL